MAFDKSKFMERFRTEAKERIQNLNQGLLDLEKNPQEKGLLETLMREAHTIKGSARMMGFKEIAELVHKMEDGLVNALKGSILMEKRHFSLLFNCLDALEILLEDKSIWEAKGIDQTHIDKLCKETAAAFQIGEEPPARQTEPVSSQAVQIHAENRVEKEEAEKKSEKMEKEQSPSSEGGVNVYSKPSIDKGSIRVDIEKLDRLMNSSGELLVSKIRLNELVKGLLWKSEGEENKDEELGVMVKELKTVNDNVDFLTSDIQTEVMKLRMLPISNVFHTFPRAMRDLAVERGKGIVLEMRGEDTELDKNIIDEMKDPLMHILRNSIDHGIEELEERKKKNKPPTGHILLNAYQKGSQVIIEASDDGGGIDTNKVRGKAVNKGLVSREKVDEMADEQVYKFLFMPGFSTKEDVTEISGRGVGLDVVREKVGRLKGTVEIVSIYGSGTKFIIKLPLTLAITESLLVRAGTEMFVIPIDTVVETIRISFEEIKRVETKEAFTVRGQITPLVRLSEVFGLAMKGIIEKRTFPVVVVQSGEKKIGFLVDELLGRQEIVSKTIGDPLRRVRHIAGATILGSGRVILILDIASIIEYSEAGFRGYIRAQQKPLTPRSGKKTILLAEDSLSTATLEKSILESFGFSVVIARDGKEALEKVTQEKFDLIITDVLMPRMNGFELTEKLKSLDKNIPVIIVTSRENDEDKKRGLEAGADAYMLKQELTSEGLLDTIERFIG